MYTSTPSSDNDYTEGNTYSGYICRLLPEGIAEVDLLTNYWYDGATWATKPSQPTQYHQWSGATASWVDPRTLQDHKDAKWFQIKQARTNAEYAGFTWDGSVFDSDATSQNRITGAVTLATLGSAFTIDWILADNTARTLTQMDMIQVGVALGQHVAAQFSKGALLREAIEVATTQAEVEAVVW